MVSGELGSSFELIATNHIVIYDLRFAIYDWFLPLRIFDYIELVLVVSVSGE